MRLQCTRCLQDGSYQDGEYTDDINMCWKYWSHDAYPMTAKMMSLADQQGTLNIKLSDWYAVMQEEVSVSESRSDE